MNSTTNTNNTAKPVAKEYRTYGALLYRILDGQEVTDKQKSFVRDCIELSIREELNAHCEKHDLHPEYDIDTAIDECDYLVDDYILSDWLIGIYHDDCKGVEDAKLFKDQVVRDFLSSRGYPVMTFNEDLLTLHKGIKEEDINIKYLQDEINSWNK